MKILKKLINKLLQVKNVAAGSVEEKKGKKKTIAFIVLTIGNVFAVSAASFAWFIAATSGAEMKTVSGDLGIEINKVTAYKYIYPYYAGSNEFIDYDSEGTIKGYTLEDSDYVQPSVTENVTTITMNLPIDEDANYKAVATSADDANRGPERVYMATSSFRYHLVGNETFTGLADDSSTPEWSTSTASSFALMQDATLGSVATLSNVIVSVGSEFIFLDSTKTKTISSVKKCRYYSYSAIDDTTCFELIDGNCLRCKKTGIYSFSFNGSTLTITLTSRTDSAVIGSSILDPTKISIDYAGSVDHEDYPTALSYLPMAIYEQNTMVILDVELSFSNTNDVEACLRLLRTPLGLISPAIQPLPGKYANTTSHLTGYIEGGAHNPLLASDFFSFYPVFASSPFADATAMWESMHQLTNKKTNETFDFTRFDNGESFDTTKECITHEKELGDKIVRGANTLTTRHCYIGIEYDYERALFFLDRNRLGKTYLLDRDFGFYFTAKQYTGGTA